MDMWDVAKDVRLFGEATEYKQGMWEAERGSEDSQYTRVACIKGDKCRGTRLEIVLTTFPFLSFICSRMFLR